MILCLDELALDLPIPKRPSANDAAAIQELLGGKVGEMSTLLNYTFQSFNFRGHDRLHPFYVLTSAIAAEEHSHIEAVSYAINLLLTGVTERGTDPKPSPLLDAVDARNPYHLLASSQAALPFDSMGNPWTGRHVNSSGNLRLDLLHNFFLECGARVNKIRAYKMVPAPCACIMIGCAGRHQGRALPRARRGAAVQLARQSRLRPRNVQGHCQEARPLRRVEATPRLGT